MTLASSEPNQAATVAPASPSRLRRWARRLGLLLLLLGLTALLAEGVVLLVLGEQPKFPRRVVSATWGLRINEPGARYRHKSADVNVTFEINGQGMRADREFAHAKPAGKKRIVSLGDSFTVGYEVAAEDTFSSVLERELRRDGIDVDVLNCGVSGFSTAEECLYLERELLRYEPDLVLVSFFPNDFDDNLRTGLFRLEGEKLVGGEGDYVPAGGFGDFLNRNAFFNLLSEHSNAFCALKEAATSFFKRQMVEEGAERASAASAAGAPEGEELTKLRRRLGAAIFERMYGVTRRLGIPLVIHSIPSRLGVPERTLEELFPSEFFDVKRDGLLFVSAKKVLEPELGQRRLYFDRSHGHWTPLSHELAGKELARRITAAVLLR
ncbi:MAG: hypothetical protein JNM84_05770 [Planctomycetes bacterium]|nr:hypothetical protein [Planctomycetota bacterium]